MYVKIFSIKEIQLYRSRIVGIMKRCRCSGENTRYLQPEIIGIHRHFYYFSPKNPHIFIKQTES